MFKKQYNNIIRGPMERFLSPAKREENWVQAPGSADKPPDKRKPGRPPESDEKKEERREKKEAEKKESEKKEPNEENEEKPKATKGNEDTTEN